MNGWTCVELIKAWARDTGSAIMLLCHQWAALIQSCFHAINEMTRYNLSYVLIVAPFPRYLPSSLLCPVQNYLENPVWLIINIKIYLGRFTMKRLVRRGCLSLVYTSTLWYADRAYARRFSQLIILWQHHVLQALVKEEAEQDPWVNILLYFCHRQTTSFKHL